LLLFPPSTSSGIRQENYFDPFDKLREIIKRNPTDALNMPKDNKEKSNRCPEHAEGK